MSEIWDAAGRYAHWCLYLAGNLTIGGILLLGISIVAAVAVVMGCLALLLHLVANFKDGLAKGLDRR